MSYREASTSFRAPCAAQTRCWPASLLRCGTGYRGHTGLVSLIAMIVLVFGMAAGAEAQQGMNIPTGHPRLWWTPGRISQAQTWYASNPFTPEADDALNNAFRYICTGETAYAQTAINLLMAFTVPQSELDGVSSDHYRWADWVPLVYDWCYNEMTPSQRSTFMARYNGYVDIIRQKPWGGPTMPSSNYYWGYFRNELNWAIATYHDSAMADTFLNWVCVNRWQNASLPYAATGVGLGGVPAEGTQYGRYMLAYPVSCLTSAGLLGRDMYRETNFYKESLFYYIYATSTGTVYNKAGTSQYYQMYSFNDNEIGAYPSSGTSYYGDWYFGDMLLAIANEWSSVPVGQYARYCFNTIQPTPSKFVAAVDSGGSQMSLSGLPLDYYGPGFGSFYVKNSWNASATQAWIQIGKLDNGGGHQHLDWGTFHILRGNRWLTSESPGYSRQTTGFGGSGIAGTPESINHNSILFTGNGWTRGCAEGYQDGETNVTRLESRTNYAYVAADLSGVYKARTSNYIDPVDGGPRDDNPFAETVVREFLFVRPLETWVVFDRVLSCDNTRFPPTVLAADAIKTFVLHSDVNPTVEDSNHVRIDNNGQTLRVSTLLPTTHSYYILYDNNTAGSDYAKYRLEVNHSGEAQSYFLHVLQARDSAGANVTANVTDDGPTYTVTMTHPTLGNATVVFTKGATSTGGQFGYATSGPPTLAALADYVQGISVTDNGPVWSPGAGGGLQILTTSLPADTINVAYNQTLTASGGTTPYTWSVLSGSLPSGLSLGSSTGTISGTPTTANTYNFTVRVTDNAAATDDQALSIVVNPVPSITTSSLPGGTTGVAYNQTLSATGGTTPYAWAVSNGSLPTGLSLNAGTGAITGTPTATGTSNFTARVTDAVGATATRALSIAIAGGTLTITTSSLPDGAIGIAYSQTLQATGGSTPYTWSLSAGSLPAGLSLVPSTGAITGTPTTSGTSSFTARVTDNLSATATRALSITIGATQNVTLQDGLSGYSGTTDAWLNSDSPDVNYGADGNGHLQYNTADRQIHRFDVSSIPSGSTVNSATIYFYAYNVTGGTPGVSCYRVLTHWDEMQATWSNRLTGTAWGTAGLQAGVDYNASVISTATVSAPGWVSFNATSTVQGWVNGSYVNEGVVYLETSVGHCYTWMSEYATDTSLRPKLFVSYTTPALSITTSSLPAGSVGTPYSQTLSATGGSTPYTWAVISGGLPAGLSLGSSTGTISGTPTTAQTANFTVRVTDNVSATATKALSITITGGGTTYEVGPGKPYTNIGDVPWESIAAGDTVLIYYRATPYKEKFAISAQGTAVSPITIRGVAGPGGELPILDGENATTRLAQSYWNDERCIIKVGGGTVPVDQVAKYITIENIDFTSARPPYTYTCDEGTVKSYIYAASGIFVCYGENITVRNCVFRNCGNGFFVASSDDPVSKNILVEGCYLYGNGNSARTTEHNSYCAAMGITYQYNHYGAPRSGCPATGLKDRSSGMFVRFNWIELPTTDGNRQIDFVEAEDSAAIVADPAYRKSFCYGNVIIEGMSGNRQICNYGGDNPGNESIYRHGCLYFYNNTVVSTRTDANTLFHLITVDETVDCRNNVIYGTLGGSSLAITSDESEGTVTMRNNWLKPGYTSGGGVVSDLGNVTGSSPGFVNEGAQDYHLTGGSQCVNAGTTLHAECAAYPVDRQYVTHQSSEARPVSGALDIGAYEYVGGVPDLVITTTSVPNGQIGVAYSQTLAATGGQTPYSWSMNGGSLPAGLSLSSGGVISGTPTTAGTSNFTVRVTDSQGTPDTDDQALSITIPANLVVTTTSLPTGRVATAYSQTVSASGGTTPYTWSVVGGSLPTGLSLGSSSGTISGTPTTAQTANFTVRVTDSQAPSDTDDQALSITIYPDLVVTTTSLPNGTVAVAYSQSLAATGGVAPYSWSLVSGSLPTGLSLSSGGVISGTPTTANTYNFTVRVTDSQGAPDTDDQALSITVSSGIPDLVITTTTLPGGTVGVAYSQTVVATGGTTPYTWSILSGSLPAGLSLGSSTGTISGTPTTAQTSNFTVRVTDSQGTPDTDDQALSITIAPADLVITTTTLPGGTVGASYSQTIVATGGVTPYSWSISSGSLPAGLSISSSTGVISGTPTTAQTSNFTVRVQDSQGTPDVDTQALSITIAPANLVITTTSVPAGTVGTAYSQTLSATGGTTPYTWSVLSGSLPAGLSLGSSTGTISGTPTTEQTANFTVRVTDSQGTPDTDDQALSIAVSSGGGGDPTYWQASSDAPSQTTSITWQTKVTLQFTPTAADDYLIIGYAEHNCLGDTRTLARMTVDGVVEGDEIRRHRDWYPFYALKSTSLSASTHTITIDYRCYDGTIATTMRNARIVVIRKASIEWFTAAADSQQTITTTATDFVTMNFTPSAAGDYLLLWAAEVHSIFGVDAAARSRLDGATVHEGLFNNKGDDNEAAPMVTFAVQNLTAAQHTMTLQAQTPSGSGLWIRRCRVAAVRLTGGRFADYAYAAADTESQTTSTTFVEKLSKTWTSGSTGNWLAMMSSSTGQSDPYRGVDVQMQYNDATTVSANTHLPMDTTEYLAAAGVGVFNVTGGSRRMDVDYRSNHASWAAKIRQVHLALLPLDAGYPDLQITTTSLPDGAVGAAYSQALAATGGLAPYSWSLNGGSLPSGLSLSSGGVISGTPTAGGTSNFTVRATDSQGTPDTDDQALSITVTAPPAATYAFAAADTESNTTSTTYQTKTTLNFTSSVTDDWVILSFAEYKGSSESYSTYVRTVVDGTTESEILGEPNDATDYMSYSSVKVRNLAAGSHTITVQYRSENSGATARIRNARVVAIRKASLDVRSTASDSVVALTTTLTDRATLTFTPASAGDYLVIWSAEISANTGYSTRIQANVPTGTWDEGWVESKDNTDYFPWMSFAIYGVPASSTSFRITAAKEGGSGTHNIRKARIVAIRLDGRFADYEAGSSDSEATTTSTSFVEKYTKSWTAGPNGNWLILNSARIAGTAANYSIEARVHLNDATVLAQPLREPDDTTDYMNFVSVDVRNLTTPRKVDVDYRSENASMTAKIRYVRFAGLSLDD